MWERYLQILVPIVREETGWICGYHKKNFWTSLIGKKKGQKVILPGAQQSTGAAEMLSDLSIVQESDRSMQWGGEDYRKKKGNEYNFIFLRN